MSFFSSKPASSTPTVIYVPQTTSTATSTDTATDTSVATDSATDTKTQAELDEERRRRIALGSTTVTGPMGVIGDATLSKSSLLGGA